MWQPFSSVIYAAVKTGGKKSGRRSLQNHKGGFGKRTQTDAAVASQSAGGSEQLASYHQQHAAE